MGNSGVSKVGQNCGLWSERTVDKQDRNAGCVVDSKPLAVEHIALFILQNSNAL